MIVPEPVAKMRFCPFGRGAMPLKPGSEKFASGINMSPNGPLTTCEGRRCMLWEEVDSVAQESEVTCPKCQAKEELKDACAECGGKGTFKVMEQIPRGFCGAAPGHMLALCLQEVNKTLKVAMGQSERPSFWERLTTPLRHWLMERAAARELSKALKQMPGPTIGAGG